MFYIDFEDMPNDLLLHATKVAWNEFCNEISVGTKQGGVVSAVEPYGVYIDIGRCFPVLIEVPNLLRERYPISPLTMPAIGTHLSCEIIQFVDNRRLARAIELVNEELLFPPR